MSDTYHPSSFSIRSASLNLMYVSSLQLYNNTYFTYCQEKNIKNIRILRRYYMQIPGKYADWQQEIRESPQMAKSVKVRCPAASYPVKYSVKYPLPKRSWRRRKRQRAVTDLQVSCPEPACPCCQETFQLPCVGDEGFAAANATPASGFRSVLSRAAYSHMRGGHAYTVKGNFPARPVPHHLSGGYQTGRS